MEDLSIPEVPGSNPGSPISQLFYTLFLNLYMDYFRKLVAKSISESANLDEKKIYQLLEYNDKNDRGDICLPCFTLGKKINPGNIALNLRKKIVLPKQIERAEVMGPYINFFIKKEFLVNFVSKDVIKNKNKFGSKNIGRNKKIVIEHTSINPNASPHIGRARNAIIGNSISKLYEFFNYNPEIHYFVNDIGKQIAMLVYAAGGKSYKFEELLDLYKSINDKVKENENLEKEILMLLYKFENGDKKVIKEFNKIVKVAVKGITNILGKLNIKYDSFDYESEYLQNNKVSRVISKLNKTGKLFEDEEGRFALDLSEYNLPMKNPVMILTRSDKTSLYGLRDIAYAIDKQKISKTNIAVIGEEQKLYTKQVNSALDILNKSPIEIIHYSLVLGKDGKLSTRKGNVPLLSDLLDEVYELAKKEISSRSKGKRSNSNKIGNAAIIYSMLRVSPEKNVVFNPEQAVKFEGDTGPYQLYTYARINSLLKKSSNGNVNSKLVNEAELDLIKFIAKFPNITEKAMLTKKTNLIPNYCSELCQKFNSYYSQNIIISDDKNLTNHRIGLIKLVKQVIENSMFIMGIETIQEM